MNVAELLVVTAVDVHVIVVTFLVLLDEVRDAAQNVFLRDGVEEADQVVVQAQEHEVARDILLGSVGGEEWMNFSPQERGGDTAEVQWPRRVEHVLKGDGNHLQ